MSDDRPAAAPPAGQLVPDRRRPWRESALVPLLAAWVALQLAIHLALALPGLVFLRLLTLGRWPRLSAEEDGARPSDAWFAVSAFVGLALWIAVGLGVAALLRR